MGGGHKRERCPPREGKEASKRIIQILKLDVPKHDHEPPSNPIDPPSNKKEKVNEQNKINTLNLKEAPCSANTLSMACRWGCQSGLLVTTLAPYAQPFTNGGNISRFCSGFLSRLAYRFLRSFWGRAPKGALLCKSSAGALSPAHVPFSVSFPK